MRVIALSERGELRGRPQALLLPLQGRLQRGRLRDRCVLRVFVTGPGTLDAKNTRRAPLACSHQVRETSLSVTERLSVAFGAGLKSSTKNWSQWNLETYVRETFHSPLVHTQWCSDGERTGVNKD